jgi:cytochrome c1
MMQEVGCHACHVIPGVRGPAGLLGPPLAGYSHNIYVAGKFPGTPDVLVRWIRDAPSLAPGTAMPESPVSEAEARDMAAYLYSLE